MRKSFALELHGEWSEFADECIRPWVLKKSELVLGVRGLSSGVELVGMALTAMKWREPVTSLVG